MAIFLKTKSNLDNSKHFPLIAVVKEELHVPKATLELTYCGCKQLQNAKRTDVAVIILGLNASLCVVFLNVLNGPNNNNN